MSYCVHCGVKLADSEKDCPLCFTPVNDPSRESTEDAIPAFPERLDKPRGKINIRFLTLLVAVMLLFPLMVVIIIDVLYNNNLTWSLYVLGAEVCVWSFIILPLNCSSLIPYPYIAICYAVTLGYVFLIHLVSHGNGWFANLAFPLSIIAIIFTLLSTSVVRNRRINKLGRAGILFLFLSILLVGVDATVVYFLTETLHPSWSWYVSIPVFAFGLMLLGVSRSVRICEWIRRKLFI